MSDLKKFSDSAGGNNAASPNGFPEGMAPSGVNDSARELMAAVKRWYDDAEWRDFDDTPTQATVRSFTVSGNWSSRYHTDRRIRITEDSGEIKYATITSSSFSTNTRVSLLLDSGSLSVSLSSVAVGFEATNDSLPRGNLVSAGDSIVFALTLG